MTEKRAVGRPSKYRPAYCEQIVLTPSEAKKVEGEIVYGLCDLDGRVFYVGKTTNAKKRIAAHSEGRNNNPQMRDRMRGRKDWGVVVLRKDPVDLDAAEREEIAKREDSGILNIILSDSGVWDMYKKSPRPWISKSGKRSPLTIAQNYAGKEARPIMRRKLRKMTDAQRCAAELVAYSEMDERLRLSFSQWAEDTIVDMVRCVRESGIKVELNV